MLVSDFDYDLPEELIAQKPLAERDRSRMMVVDRKKGDIIHSSFRNFNDYLAKNDVLVFNTSKVIPAKIWGKNRGKEIEFLFLKALERGVWEVLCKPAKKVRNGDVIHFSTAMVGRIIDIEEEGKRILDLGEVDVLEELQKGGYAPLPPYIKRKKSQIELQERDIERYQTVFAERPGSIAAPTAGLHLTDEMIKSIR